MLMFVLEFVLVLPCLSLRSWTMFLTLSIVAGCDWGEVEGWVNVLESARFEGVNRREERVIQRLRS